MPPGGMDIWEKFGYAGLFVFMYLGTVGYLLRKINEHKDEIKKLTEQAIGTVVLSTQAINEQSRTNEKVSEALRDVTEQTSQFIAFQKGRDAGGSR